LPIPVIVAPALPLCVAFSLPVIIAFAVLTLLVLIVVAEHAVALTASSLRIRGAIGLRVANHRAEILERLLRKTPVIRLVVAVEDTWAEFNAALRIESVVVALTVKADTLHVLIRHFLRISLIAVKVLAIGPLPARLLSTSSAPRDT
jgi:hypothetical protein